MKKAKTTRKKKTSWHSRSFAGANSVKMLAVVLMAIIFVDGMMFGLITAGDVHAGLEVLDLSASVRQTYADTSAVLQPMIDVASSVNSFYEMAATQTMFLLDNNLVTNISSLFADVGTFYDMASREMAAALDISEQLYPNVAYAAY